MDMEDPFVGIGVAGAAGAEHDIVNLQTAPVVAPHAFRAITYQV
jgi:hypothetical protein